MRPDCRVFWGGEVDNLNETTRWALLMVTSANWTTNKSIQQKATIMK